MTKRRWFVRAAVVLILLFAVVTPSTSRAVAGQPHGRQARSGEVVLDHVPIAVLDLSSARSRWSDALGFTIKPGRMHENTIENSHIKFADGSALELITASRPADPLAAAYLELLEAGDGGAYLALRPSDFEGLEGMVTRVGLEHDVVAGPYYRWLTFPSGAPLGFLFFNELTTAPADAPEVLRHANGALGLGSVWISAGRAAAVRDLLASIGLETGYDPVILPDGRTADRVRLHDGDLYIYREGEPAGRPITGLTIIVEDIDRARDLLHVDANAIQSGADGRGSFVRVPPRLANGMWLEFLERAETGLPVPDRRSH